MEYHFSVSICVWTEACLGVSFYAISMTGPHYHPRFCINIHLCVASYCLYLLLPSMFSVRFLYTCVSHLDYLHDPYDPHEASGNSARTAKDNLLIPGKFQLVSLHSESVSTHNDSLEMVYYIIRRLISSNVLLSFPLSSSVNGVPGGCAIIRGVVDPWSILSCRHPTPTPSLHHESFYAPPHQVPHTPLYRGFLQALPQAWGQHCQRTKALSIFENTTNMYGVNVAVRTLHGRVANERERRGGGGRGVWTVGVKERGRNRQERDKISEWYLAYFKAVSVSVLVLYSIIKEWIKVCDLAFLGKDSAVLNSSE